MSTATEFERPVEILLAEDSPTDAHLTKEALSACSTPHRLHHVVDGVEALEFLRHEGKHNDAPRPDLILLDLKMPRKDGCEVLRELKADDSLRHIPVIVLTTSVADDDVRSAYALHANCYVHKPIDFSRFVDMVRTIDRFWFTIVTLPSR
jgi:CheY-like chemotaxis protein